MIELHGLQAIQASNAEPASTLQTAGSARFDIVGPDGVDPNTMEHLLGTDSRNPNVRASLRARLEEGHGGGPVNEYRNVTPLGWGEQFHAPVFVSREALRLIEASGGGR